jgi:hypothetical protein
LKVEGAKQLQAGDRISYPADRGNKAGVATVRRDCADASVNKNFRGDEYIWVGTDAGVWPSNRINRSDFLSAPQPKEKNSGDS